jgi:hypothetical protein
MMKRSGVILSSCNYEVRSFPDFALWDMGVRAAETNTIRSMDQPTHLLSNAIVGLAWLWVSLLLRLVSGGSTERLTHRRLAVAAHFAWHPGQVERARGFTLTPHAGDNFLRPLIFWSSKRFGAARSDSGLCPRLGACGSLPT